MPRCATAFSEQREATSIEDFPEELRAQALATPEHFHEIILRAYNKPPRRLRDIRRRHVRFNPPSGCNLGENLLWLLECAAAGTPIFEVGPSWISKGGRGVFRTKYCVRLPKYFQPTNPMTRIYPPHPFNSYTAPRSSEYGMVREMLVGYGNTYDV